MRSFSCRSQLELCLCLEGALDSPSPKSSGFLDPLSSVGKSERSPSSPVSTRVDEAFQDVIMFDSYTECGRKRLVLLSWQRSGKNLLCRVNKEESDPGCNSVEVTWLIQHILSEGFILISKSGAILEGMMEY